MEKPSIYELLKKEFCYSTVPWEHGPAIRLEEKDYRGERFADFPHDLKGNIDLLSLTRPELIGRSTGIS